MFAKDTIFVSCEFLNCISELQNSIKHRPQINTSVLLIPVLLLSWLQIALQASPRVQMCAGHGRIKPREVAASSRGRRLCLQTCKGHWQWTRKIRHYEQLWWNSDHFTEQSGPIAGGFNRLSLVMQSHRRGLLSRRGSWLLGLVMVTKDLLGEYYFLLSSWEKQVSGELDQFIYSPFWRIVFRFICWGWYQSWALLGLKGFKEALCQVSDCS